MRSRGRRGDRRILHRMDVLMTSSQTYTYPSHIPFDTDGLTMVQANAAIVQIARRIVEPVLGARKLRMWQRCAELCQSPSDAMLLAGVILGGITPSVPADRVNAILNVARYNLYDPVLGFDYGGADVARAEAAKIEHEVRYVEA